MSLLHIYGVESRSDEEETGVSKLLKGRVCLGVGGEKKKEVVKALCTQ